MNDEVEELVRTYAIGSLDTHTALYNLCGVVTDSQLDAIPDLRDWYEWHRWWKSLTDEKRAEIFKRNWSYD